MTSSRTAPSPSPVTEADVSALLERLAGLKREIGRVIVGQETAIEELLLAFLAGGHGLLEGVPGLAKTLMIRTLADAVDLSFRRIQFTPDLMPSDIIGTEILEEEHATGRRFFKFVKGPVFANIVLADEINRTPPKTQAALLQAMQEKEVTAGGETWKLELPFFVLATQNPIELEGTYPLPEAQLDRFMFNVRVDYPNAADEEKIVATTTSSYEAALERVLGAADILALQKLVRRVPVADHVVRYAVRLARATRGAAAADGGAPAPEFVQRWVSWGAGPRASQFLVLGGKTRAVLRGRFAPGIEDIQAVAPAVLRHRIVTNFNAEAEGIKPDRIIADLLKSVPTE